MTLYKESKKEGAIKLNLEQEASRPVVTSITFWDKDNYVNFSDTDSSTDYFHSYSIGINAILERITTSELWQAAAVVKVSFGNNEDLAKYHKRLKQLQKALSYSLKTVEKKGIYRISENSQMCYITPYKYNEYFLYDSNLVKENQIIV
jgi:hypothetical protein